MTHEQRIAEIREALKRGKCWTICVADLKLIDAAYESIDTLAEELKKQSDRADKAEQLVCDFQAAAMIDVSNQGGPCCVKPEHVEKHVTELRQRVDTLAAECLRLREDGLNIALFKEVVAEQRHGREKHGRGPDDLSHDDWHSDEAWHEFIAEHNHRARNATPMERRQHLIKAAGLCLSAVEAFDRSRQALDAAKEGE